MGGTMLEHAIKTLKDQFAKLARTLPPVAGWSEMELPTKWVQ